MKQSRQQALKETSNVHHNNPATSAGTRHSESTVRTDLPVTNIGPQSEPGLASHMVPVEPFLPAQQTHTSSLRNWEPLKTCPSDSISQEACEAFDAEYYGEMMGWGETMMITGDESRTIEDTVEEKQNGHHYPFMDKQGGQSGPDSHVTAGTWTFSVDENGEDTYPFGDALPPSPETHATKRVSAKSAIGTWNSDQDLHTDHLGRVPPFLQDGIATSTNDLPDDCAISTRINRGIACNTDLRGTYEEFLEKTTCDGCGEKIEQDYIPVRMPIAFPGQKQSKNQTSTNFGLMLKSHPRYECWEKCVERVEADPLIQSKMTKAWSQYKNIRPSHLVKDRVKAVSTIHVAYPCSECQTLIYWPMMTKRQGTATRVPKPSSKASLHCGRYCSGKTLVKDQSCA